MTEHDARPFPLTTTELREFVRGEVHKALHPEIGTPEPDQKPVDVERRLIALCVYVYERYFYACGEERERWDEVYRRINALLLDVQVEGA